MHASVSWLNSLLTPGGLSSAALDDALTSAGFPIESHTELADGDVMALSFERPQAAYSAPKIFACFVCFLVQIRSALCVFAPLREILHLLHPPFVFWWFKSRY